MFAALMNTLDWSIYNVVCVCWIPCPHGHHGIRHIRRTNGGVTRAALRVVVVENHLTGGGSEGSEGSMGGNDASQQD